ncbi:hypothetical protein VTI74DRAFT_7456 [Chaetomium olivicolor]
MWKSNPMSHLILPPTPELQLQLQLANSTNHSSLSHRAPAQSLHGCPIILSHASACAHVQRKRGTPARQLGAAPIPSRAFERLLASPSLYRYAARVSWVVLLCATPPPFRDPSFGLKFAYRSGFSPLLAKQKGAGRHYGELLEQYHPVVVGEETNASSVPRSCGLSAVAFHAVPVLCNCVWSECS